MCDVMAALAMNKMVDWFAPCWSNQQKSNQFSSTNQQHYYDIPRNCRQLWLSRIPGVTVLSWHINHNVVAFKGGKPSHCIELYCSSVTAWMWGWWKSRIGSYLKKLLNACRWLLKTQLRAITSPEGAQGSKQLPLGEKDFESKKSWKFAKFPESAPFSKYIGDV
jgi:hypothetical protein